MWDLPSNAQFSVSFEAGGVDEFRLGRSNTTGFESARGSRSVALEAVTRIKAPDLASPAFKANSYPFYARLRSEAPAFRMKVGLGLWGWLVTRYDDAVLVLKDERFANDWSPRVPVPSSLWTESSPLDSALTTV